MDHRRGTQRGVSESRWAMGADMRRGETTPRVFRRRDDDRIDGDWNRRVFGLGRYTGEGDRDRVRSGVAPLQPRDRCGRIGAGMVRVIAGMIDDKGRGNRVDMRRHAVLMLRVLMARIRVHVLERCRPGGREHRAHDDGRNGSEHQGECMCSVHYSSNP